MLTTKFCCIILKNSKVRRGFLLPNGWYKKGLVVIELMAFNDQCHLSSRMEFAPCSYNFKEDRQLVAEYYETPITVTCCI